MGRGGGEGREGKNREKDGGVFHWHCVLHVVLGWVVVPLPPDEVVGPVFCDPFFWWIICVANLNWASVRGLNTSHRGGI